MIPVFSLQNKINLSNTLRFPHANYRVIFLVDASRPAVETLSMIRLSNLSDEFGTNSNYIVYEFYTPGHFPSVLPKLLTAIITTKRGLF